MTTLRDRRAARRPATALAAALGSLALLTLAAGCSKPAARSADPKTGASQGLSTVDSPAADPTTVAPQPSGATTATTATVKPTKTSGGLGAVIVSFKVTQQPLCAIVGTSAAPYHRDAQDIVLSWQVTGANAVELYVDGGLYTSSNAIGTQQLYFACTNKPKQSHTYKLVTKGGPGQAASKSITVTADNNPPA